MSETEATGGKPDVVMCVLSYLGILSLIPLFLKKDDAFIQWHAKQGLVMAIAFIVLTVVLSVVAGITGLSILAMISGLVGLAYLILMIICILKAVGGGKFEVPVISGLIGKVPNV